VTFWKVLHLAYFSLYATSFKLYFNALLSVYLIVIIVAHLNVVPLSDVYLLTSVSTRDKLTSQPNPKSRDWQVRDYGSKDNGIDRRVTLHVKARKLAVFNAAFSISFRIAEIEVYGTQAGKTVRVDGCFYNHTMSSKQLLNISVMKFQGIKPFFII